MTKAQLHRTVLRTLAVYFMAILGGLALKYYYPARADPIYSVYRDLIPLFIAIPGAWLGYCFSRRVAFLRHLRELWSDVNRAVQSSVQYTHLPQPSREEYAETLNQMSFVIDEVRCAFKNVGEAPGTRGLYPFEPIKEINREVRSLQFGEAFRKEEAPAARRRIVKAWKRVQQPFLAEFERQEPTVPATVDDQSS